MAAERIYDPHILVAEAGMIDWAATARARGQETEIRDVVRRMGGPRSIFLRWRTSPRAGLPSDPFKVWRRPAVSFGAMKAIDPDVFILPLFNVLQFAEPLTSVTLFVRTVQPAMVTAFAIEGAPMFDRVVATQSKSLPANGIWALTFHTPIMTAVMISRGPSFDTVRGVTVAAAEADQQNWQLVETVGLPVDAPGWAALPRQTHGAPQGLTGSEVSAPEAAGLRFKRGINPLGWWPTFSNGHGAPLWELPDPALLVEEAALEVLPALRLVAPRPPNVQAEATIAFDLPPPQNAAGETMPGETGKARVSPVGLLQMAVSTDPMLAVVLGYGTGYAEEDIPEVTAGDMRHFGDPAHSDWDWMVTGRWARGLDGRSEEVEYASIIRRPGFVLPAPLPADLTIDFQSHARPATTDGDWAATVRLSWERFPLPNLARVASFAAARRSTGPGGPAAALLEKRAFAGGMKPIGEVMAPEDTEPTRQSATDGGLPIPNAPGSIAQRYAVANQNIFGLWSPWVAETFSTTQPAPGPVAILAADLAARDPGTGSVCPARLQCEISVDWRVRSPGEILFRGRLYGVAKRGDAPPAGAVGTGLPRSLGGPSVPTRVTFSGDEPSMVGGKVECLNVEGTEIVAAGEAGQGRGARRYRITIPTPDQPVGATNLGISLDFAAAPHIGVLLEARSTDRIPPQHQDPWPERPAQAVASDPRSRGTTNIDLVRLASLPDARGECHARLSWGAVESAYGYAIYETDETKMRASRGMPDPAPDMTLSQRLTVLKEAFAALPRRDDFVRRNAEPLKTTSTDVTLPRGSQVIHLFAIIPVGKGGIEGPWPSGADADEFLIPYAAPRLAMPAPPSIEARAVEDPEGGGWSVRLRVATRPAAGARPKRVDFYRVRVDDAARQLDSMGPPLATLEASTGAWQVTAGGAGDDTWIETVAGADAPGGSWRRVWYRAVAWGGDDPPRGVLKARSRPSPAVSVVIPPAGLPDLSPLDVEWPGGGIGDVLVRFTSEAPVAPTPLGAHRIVVEAGVPQGASLVSLDLALADVAETDPPTGSGLSRSASGYRLLLRRGSVDDRLGILVRVIDPMRRARERFLRVGSGSVMPLPDLTSIEAAAGGTGVRVYSFGTTAPLESGLPQPYRLQMEIVPATPPRGGGIVGPPVIGVDLRGGPPPPTVAVPRQQFTWNGSAYVLDRPLSSVPTSVPAGTPGPLTISRRTALGRSSFSVRATEKMTRVVARVVTPDGRSAEVQRKG